MPFDVIAAAGDIIQNLRSSLDHLAYQLVIVGTNGIGPANPRKVQFPIAESITRYEASKAAQVEGMRDDAKLAIDAAKPYKGGNEALWKIHELNNIDKHRMLFTVAEDYMFCADWLPGPFGPGSGSYVHKTDKPMFAGVFDDDVEKDLQSEIDKAVGQPEVADSGALIPTLHKLIDFTDRFVATFLPILE